MKLFWGTFYNASLHRGALTRVPLTSSYIKVWSPLQQRSVTDNIWWVYRYSYVGSLAVGLSRMQLTPSFVARISEDSLVAPARAAQIIATWRQKSAGPRRATLIRHLSRP